MQLFICSKIQTKLKLDYITIKIIGKKRLVCILISIMKIVDMELLSIYNDNEIHYQ